MKHILSNSLTRCSLTSTVFVWVGSEDTLQVCSLLTKDALCRLHLDYSFSSCFLHWHREDAPEALPSQTPPASKILKGEEESKAQATPAPAARQRETEGGAEIGRQREKIQTAKVSDRCRDVSGGCPACTDSDKDQQLQQEGGIIKKSG